MKIKLRQLEAFVAVARYSQSTLAAQSLHISQPALSMLARERESALDRRLLDRTPNGVQFTTERNESCAVADRTLGELQTAIDNVHELIALKDGHVTVACSTVTAALTLPTIISDFRALYPNIQIAIQDSVEQNLAN